MRRKRLLILGASRYYIRSIIAAKDMGCEVIVTDRNPASEGFRYADFYEIIDITDINKTIATAKRYRVDGVLAVNDFGVQTAAAVAHSLGLAGIGSQVSKYATNKAWMRRIWEQKGVPSARFRVVTSLEQAVAATEELEQWPLIVKPTDSRGGGSRGVSRIDCPAQIGSAFKFAQSFYEEKSVIIEEFLDGVEHSMETITYKGKTHILAISDKEKTNPPYCVDRSVIYPSFFSGTELQEIQNTAQKAVQAIGIDLGAAHIELCSTQQGPKLFEIGARCGGGGTPDPIVPFLTGVEMFKEVARIALGEEPRHLAPLFMKGCVYRFLMPAPGRIKAITGIEKVKKMKGILDCDVLVEESDDVKPVKVGQDRAGFIIGGAESRQEALNIVDKAEEIIRFDYEKP